jgi:cyclic-di-GMP phosphodiesterase, flagellum assembly factor TipF
VGYGTGGEAFFAAKRVKQRGITEFSMVRVSAVFVALCMALIAVSLGAVSYLRFDLSGVESALVGFAVLMALVAYNTLAARLRDRADAAAQISALASTSSDMTRQLAEFGRRLNAVDGRVERGLERSLEKAEPLASGLEELSTQVKELAGSVAAHDAALGAAGARYGGSPAEAAAFPDSAVGSAAAEVAAAPMDHTVDAFDGLDREAIVDLVRGAIDAARVDLYLQPIVTLPKRTVRYYEATSRLKAESGEVIAPSGFVKYAQAGSLMPKLDHMAAMRCVQVVRRLLLKNREIGLFCNLSSATLADSEFPQLLEFLDANRAIAPSLVFQFAQSAVRTMGPAEHESLAALAARGFRFSMDEVADLQVDPRELKGRGFRFFKVPAPLLLSRAAPAATDVAPADLSGLLSGFGIGLLAGQIDSEETVAGLVDYKVQFGQGNLFAPPRPVRAEALQGADGEEAKQPAKADRAPVNPGVVTAEPKSSADLLASAAAAANDSLGAPRTQVVRR